MTTCEWFRFFKNGRTSMDDDELHGRPSTLRSKHLITQMESIISIGLCHTNLMEGLGMHRVSAEFMPRRLTDDLQRANDDENLLKNVSQCQ
jgi:hypothetical protein